jgi:hypothetical protein
MNSRNKLILGLMTGAILALAGLCGCRSEDEASADSSNRTAMTLNDARAAVQDVTIGHQLAADGTIAADQKGNNFAQGQPVVIAFGIGKAPTGTPVNVDWYGPDNQPVASDQQNVAAGERSMSFTSKDTGKWGQGDYHADLSVGGQKVDTERFSITPPDDQAAGKANNPDHAISDVTVGHQLGADGAIAAGQDGKHFMPGDPVFIAFKTGGAPAGTAVEVDWLGPQDQKLGTETRQVATGDAMMHFSTRRTNGWGLGDYHADLLVNGQKVDTEHFSIVNANRSDKAGR